MKAMSELPAQVINDMRAWVADCDWVDVDSDNVAGLTDEQIIGGVDRHYDGGLWQFLADGDYTNGGRPPYWHPDYQASGDPKLIEALTREDAAEDAGTNPDQRRTCHTHQAWFADCCSSRLHANRVTGHNWCRTHDQAVIDCGCRPPSVEG